MLQIEEAETDVENPPAVEEIKTAAVETGRYSHAHLLNCVFCVIYIEY